MFGLVGLLTGRQGNRPRNTRAMIAIRVGLIAVLLIATLVLHLGSKDLVILRVARIVLVLALLVGVGRLRGRRARTGAAQDSGLD